MKQLTIFTPTYNRAYLLPILYKSLLRQTNNSFKWLIVDDGSKDETKQVVEEWIRENRVEINYVEQHNMGMVAAHNTAHFLIDTELNVCIDSDDYMPDDAVKIILESWNAVIDKDSYMGLVGLDIYKNGQVIGSKFPDTLKECHFSEISQKYKIYGDKKYVLRTDLIKSKLPYPYIKGEKFPAPSYLYLLLEDQYKFLLINEPLCVVEYMPDGNSMNKVAQYKKSPNAFAIYRIAKMKKALSFKEKFKQSIHFVSSVFLSKNYNLLLSSPYKITVFLSLPFGFLLALYLKNTKNTAVNKNLNKK